MPKRSSGFYWLKVLSQGIPGKENQTKLICDEDDVTGLNFSRTVSEACMCVCLCPSPAPPPPHSRGGEDPYADVGL